MALFIKRQGNMKNLLSDCRDFWTCPLADPDLDIKEGDVIVSIYGRETLIIDTRHNRGGNIDAFILEKLMRKAWFFWKDRVGKPTWNIHYAFRGHMVVLCDENTASD